MTPPGIPHDPALPHLPLALDPARMARLFEARLVGMLVQGCTIDRVKYRRQRNCSVSYRLQVRGRDGRCFEQRVAARWSTNGESPRRHAAALAAGTAPSAAGPAVQHEQALEMVACWLPNDPKLAALRLLLDDAALRERALPEVACALAGPGARVIDHRTTLVQWVPELRACARVDLSVLAAQATAPQQHSLYVKADLEQDGAVLHGVLQALRASPAAADGRLHTAAPLLWQAATGLHWQHALQGKPLNDVEPHPGPATAALLGAQLAALHNTPVPSPARLDAALLATRIDSAQRLLIDVDPGLQRWLAPLVRCLSAAVPVLAASRQVTLHGDLHAGNLLVDGHHLSFIDLDAVTRGPAVCELGDWLGTTLYQAVLDGRSAHTTIAAREAFIAAYTRAGGSAVDPRLLAAATAHHLLCRRAAGGLATLKPGRLEAVPQLLATALAIAEAGDVGAASLPWREAA